MESGVRYFLDTEFIEDGRTIDLISIGVVDEWGRGFYAEVHESEVPWDRANEWVKANVRPHLGRPGSWTLTKKQIAESLVGFVGKKPEFWGYYCDYDWVVICQLYGTMMDLPDGWPMFCMDLKQYAVAFGDPRLPEQTSTEHNAIDDAHWVRDSYLWLNAKYGSVGA